MIPWPDLRNPVYSRLDAGWSVKDACMGYSDGWYYLFFSAFYEDRGHVRSHVVGVRTRDWQAFSAPVLHLDGQADGWTGLCSPNLSRVEETGTWVLTFNSWGDHHPNGRTNDLFLVTSRDLHHWTLPPRPVAENLTRDVRAIDIAVTRARDRFVLVFKDRKHWRKLLGHRRDRARFATAATLDAPFTYLRRSQGAPHFWNRARAGFARFHLASGPESTRTHENFEFLRVDGTWYLLTTDYAPHRPFLYRISGDGTGRHWRDWLAWVDGRELAIPREAFNTAHRANAAFIADWRALDGFFYAIYAGNTERRSFARRGNNALGLARSRDLHSWAVPPNEA